MVRFMSVNDKGSVSTGSLNHPEDWPPNKQMGLAITGSEPPGRRP